MTDPTYDGLVAPAQPIQFTRDPEERIQELLQANNGYQQQARDARRGEERWRLIIAKMLKAAGIPDARADSANLHLAEPAIEAQFNRLVAAASEARGDVRNAEEYAEKLRSIIMEVAEALGPTSLDELRRIKISDIADTLKARIAELSEEAKTNEALRLIIANTATALGATIAPDCSLTFMGRLPTEAETRIKGLQDTIDRQAATIRSYRDRDVAAGKEKPKQPYTVEWIRKAGIVAEELARLIDHDEVFIRSSPGGIWRTKNETGGGNGYCVDHRDADTWTGMEAWRETLPLGPEKDVCFGLKITAS